MPKNIDQDRDQDQRRKNCCADGLEVSDFIDDGTGFHLQAGDEKSDENARLKQVPLFYLYADDREIECNTGHDGNADEKPVV